MLLLWKIVLIFPTGEIELSHMDKNNRNSYQVYQNKGLKKTKANLWNTIYWLKWKIKIIVLKTCTKIWTEKRTKPIRLIPKSHGLDKEHGGSVVKCLTGDQGIADSILVLDTVLCAWAGHFILYLVLVQTRNTCPDITEILLPGT